MTEQTTDAGSLHDRTQQGEQDAAAPREAAPHEANNVLPLKQRKPAPAGSEAAERAAARQRRAARRRQQGQQSAPAADAGLPREQPGDQPQGVILSSVGTGAIRRPSPLRSPLLLSFVLVALLPALLAGLYFAFVASDRYVSSAGFAVRGMDGGGSDLLGTFTGLANTGSTTSDSYILLRYLKSRDIIERLHEHVDLRTIYADAGADYLSRLGPNRDIEYLVDYWAKRVNTSFDNTAGIITFEVEAFTPQDSLRIATLMLEFSKELVNTLSAQARIDALAFAEAEVERAEARLSTALEQMRLFRQDENSIDPAQSAQIEIQLIGGLERQLLELRARIAALEGSVDADSPTLRTLKRQATALETQIDERQAAISSGHSDDEPNSSLTNQLAIYETLGVEREFAQKAYASALSSLETARAEAGRQQRYLAVYSNPALAQHPLYPRRLLNSLVLFAGLVIVWGIGALVTVSVRDHMS